MFVIPFLKILEINILNILLIPKTYFFLNIIYFLNNNKFRKQFIKCILKKKYFIVCFHYCKSNGCAICLKLYEYKLNLLVIKALFSVKLKLLKFNYISRIMSSLQINFCNHFIPSLSYIYVISGLQKKNEYIVTMTLILS